LNAEAEHQVSSNAARLFLPLTAVLIAGLAQAQPQGGAATLSGTITNPSGTAVAGAVITIRNAATGQSTEVRTDAAGLYTVSDLVPGDYEVSVAAAGLATKSAKISLAPGAKQGLDLALETAAAGPAPPSLGDLGFSPKQISGSAQEQALLNKRSHMLKTHQRLGLITTIPLVATLVVANRAAGKHSTASGRELHAALGGITAGMYFTTASFAIFAPKVPGTRVRGPIRLHRALAWIHGPGMVLTPILGALAYEQRSNGQKIHGVARAHGPVAIVTAAAYGLAIFSVSVKF
jgi:hypothetical protein